MTTQARGEEALGPQCATLCGMVMAWLVERQGMFTDRVQLDFGLELVPSEGAVTNRAEKIGFATPTFIEIEYA